MPLKQDIIGANELAISNINNLQSNLDTLTKSITSKQSNLSNNGGSGMPLLINNNLRHIMATSPLTALIYYNFADPNDTDNNNILLDVDVTAIQSQIGSKQTVVANVSSTEIGYLNGVTSSIQTQINAKQDSLSSGNDITLDLGQGDIYFESNIVDNDGAGFIIRTSDNPSQNGPPILSVQSSGFASRLWVGQYITSTGTNDFYTGFTGASAEEHDVAKYKHKLTDTVVEFNTPVTCGFDLSCADLTANSIYGNASIQIQSMIDTAITNAYPYWIAGKVETNGNIAVSHGRVAFTVTYVSNGVYDISFATVHPRGTAYVINLTNESRESWTAKTGGIYNLMLDSE
jgi:hypothetical protein